VSVAAIVRLSIAVGTLLAYQEVNAPFWINEMAWLGLWHGQVSELADLAG
jgi:hypothetical protein